MKKKNLVAVITLAALLVIGSISGVYAFFSADTSFENLFGVKPYAIDAYEKFESPDDWQPGDTTEKLVYVKNIGEVDAVVRISITEAWVNANGNELSNTIAVNGADQNAAIINFTNTDKWVEDAGYYYYQGILAPEAATEAFLGSVTFNSAVKNDSKAVDAAGKAYGEEGYDTTAWDAEGNYLGYKDAEGLLHKTYVSTGNGYDGAEYTLTVNIQTLQATKAAMVSEWGYNAAATAGGAFNVYGLCD